jgi:predicted transcriptional regulator
MRKIPPQRCEKIIELLNEAQEPMDTIDLARAAGVAKTTMRNYTRAMWEAGLVIRSERQISKTHRVYVYMASGKKIELPTPAPFKPVIDMESLRHLALHKAWVSEDNGVRLGSYYPMCG